MSIFYSVDASDVKRKHEGDPFNPQDSVVLMIVPEKESEAEYQQAVAWVQNNGYWVKYISPALNQSDLLDYIVSKKIALADVGDRLIKNMTMKKGIMESEMSVFGTKAIQALAYRNKGEPISDKSAIYFEAITKGESIDTVVDKIIDAYNEQEEISGKMTAVRRTASEQFNACQTFEQVDAVYYWFTAIMQQQYENYTIQSVGNAIP